MTVDCEACLVRCKYAVSRIDQRFHGCITASAGNHHLETSTNRLQNDTVTLQKRRRSEPGIMALE